MYVLPGKVRKLLEMAIALLSKKFGWLSGVDTPYDYWSTCGAKNESVCVFDRLGT